MDSGEDATTGGTVGRAVVLLVTVLEGPPTEAPIMPGRWADSSMIWVTQMGTRKAWLQLLTRGSYRVPGDDGGGGGSEHKTPEDF